jgi:hypothetical protein
MTQNVRDLALSTNPRENNISSPEEKLLFSMRMSSKCRFNASVRLKYLSNYSFFTTTILSLGLIFIPLYQNSVQNIPFSNPILSMVQIFLAVSVLVYSIVNATAKYDVRSATLDNCGVKIKVLIRRLRDDIHKSKHSNPKTQVNLDTYHQEYDTTIRESENHNRSDYIFAQLESTSDYFISGVPRLLLQLKGWIIFILPYLIPSIMMSFELVFILDILKITNIFTPILGNSCEVTLIKWSPLSN